MEDPAELPAPLHPPADESARGCIVVVDGEHYPAAVTDTIDALRRSGWRVAGAALVGGGEKLREVPDYGVPHVRAAPGQGAVDALRDALAAFRGAVSTVIDLADEPVLVLERRLELIGVAAGMGLRYALADCVLEPPTFERVAAPTLAIVGTGKRIGKTAVSAHAARIADAHLGGEGAVVVVAMGRGGPAQPVVVDRSSGPVTVERLLEISRAGSHAASDYLEGAALTGLTTVGCRRVSGGLLGTPAQSNVPEGAHLAADRSPRLVLLEGSGSCIPPVHADATLLLASTDRPQDLLDGLGQYRLGRADAVLVVGDDRAEAARMCREATRLASADVRCVPASLVPRVVGEVAGRRVAAFTTAPERALPVLERALREAGADVALASCNLARRDQLRDDLHRASQEGVDAVVVEIKAAAIDAVAEHADAAGIEVLFLDNEPRPHQPDDDLAALVRGLVDTARSRHSGEPG